MNTEQRTANILLRSAARRVLFVLIAVIAALDMDAQTDSQLSHYFEVPNYYNPAAIGGSPLVRIRAGGRLQWLGIKNAPMTFFGVADTKFKFINRFWGVGAAVQYEKAGLFRTINAGVQLGWKKTFGKCELTVGVQPGLITQTFKGSETIIPDDDDYHTTGDEGIPTTDVAGTTFDLGAGVWFTHPRFWGGVSLLHALSPTIKFQTSGQGGGSGAEGEGEKRLEFTANRTIYFMAGGNIPIKNTLFELMPSVLFRTDFGFWNFEATALARYNKFLSFGVGYRYDDSVYAVIAVEIKGFYISYSYDYATSAIMKASSGSHEVMAGYSIKLDFSEKNKNRHKSIRLM